MRLTDDRQRMSPQIFAIEFAAGRQARKPVDYRDRIGMSPIRSDVIENLLDTVITSGATVAAKHVRLLRLHRYHPEGCEIGLVTYRRCTGVAHED